MFSCKISFVLLFLFASKTAHTFIMLTANVDDIRKIARKLVSEGLADKLADTVVDVIARVNGEQDVEKLTHQVHVTERDLIKDMMSPYLDSSKGAQRFRKATRKEDPLERENKLFDNEMNREKERWRTSQSLRNWELRHHSVSPYDQQRYPEIRPSIQSTHKIKNPLPRKNFDQDSDPYPSDNKKFLLVPSESHSNEKSSQYIPNLKPIINQDLIRNNKDLFDNNPLLDHEVRKIRNRNTDIDINPESLWNEASKTKEPYKITPKTQINLDKLENNSAKGLNEDSQTGAKATSGRLGLTKKKENRWWERAMSEQGPTTIINYSWSLDGI